MKIEKKQPEFQPVTITIETQDELDQLVAMAYHTDFRTDENEGVASVIFRNLYDRGLKYSGLRTELSAITEQ